MRGASLWLDFDDCGVGSVFHVAYDFFAAKLWLAKRRRKLQKDTSVTIGQMECEFKSCINCVKKIKKTLWRDE